MSEAIDETLMGFVEQNTLEPIHLSESVASTAPMPSPLLVDVLIVPVTTTIRPQQPRTGDIKDMESLYLDTVPKLPILTKVEAAELSSKVHAGFAALAEDPSPESERIIQEGLVAKEELIIRNLRLVVPIARHYAKLAAGLKVSDLIQEGNIGLNRASELFDGRKGFLFSTYAEWWIKREIRVAIREDSPVHVPKKRKVALTAALKESAEKHEELVVTNYRDHAALQAMQGVESLNKKVRQTDDTAELGDLLADTRPLPEAEVMMAINREAIIEMLSSLNDIERDAVILVFGLGAGQARMTNAKAGEELGLTMEQVRGRVRSALKKMRSHPVAETIPDLLAED